MMHTKKYLVFFFYFAMKKYIKLKRWVSTNMLKRYIRRYSSIYYIYYARKSNVGNYQHTKSTREKITHHHIL